MKRQLLILLSAIGLFSCEKEIPIDYHQVDALYVAEACMNQENTTVRLSTTQNVTDNSRNEHVVTGATVVLSSDGYVLDTLRYTKQGIYTSDYSGIYPFTYQIDIYVDGCHFSSTSTMQQAPQLNSFRFVWKNIVGERFLFADLKLQDIQGENNCYFMHIYRNGLGYRWAVMTDEHSPGKELQQLFQCCTQRDMNKGEDDALRDGDHIEVEVRTIDRRSYDYLYSMQVMDNAGTNPIQNFTGGCLGYFSAYHVEKINMTFWLSGIEVE